MEARTSEKETSTGSRPASRSKRSDALEAASRAVVDEEDSAAMEGSVLGSEYCSYYLYMRSDRDEVFFRATPCFRATHSSGGDFAT